MSRSWGRLCQHAFEGLFFKDGQFIGQAHGHRLRPLFRRRASPAVRPDDAGVGPLHQHVVQQTQRSGAERDVIAWLRDRCHPDDRPVCEQSIQDLLEGLAHLENARGSSKAVTASA